MKVIASGFKDVFVIPAGGQWQAYPGLLIRSYMDPRGVFKDGVFSFYYEGELVMEREQTLCGLYYQKRDNQYKQLIRCGSGSAYVGIVDLRTDSSTYLRSEVFFLSAENGKTLYVPRGFAVGYLSASDRTVMVAKLEKRFEADMNLFLDPFDPMFRIPWPTDCTVVSVDTARAFARI